MPNRVVTPNRVTKWLLTAVAVFGLACGVLVPTAAAAPQAQVHTDWTTPIGALLSNGSRDPHAHGCSASVVHSPQGNVVMTAAHCVNNSNFKAFYPHYRNGNPDDTYGRWYVKKVIVPHEYNSSDHNSPFDYAFLVMLPYNGYNVEQYTGALYPQVNRTEHNTPTTIGGYNARAADLSWCQGAANPAYWNRHRYVRVDCPGMNGGTSGSPFIITGTYNVIGLMGGYDRGGDHHPGQNYSAYFDNTFAHYYNLAKQG